MADKNSDKLKTYFEAGKNPTESQFQELIDAFLDKKDSGVIVKPAENPEDTKIGLGFSTDGQLIGKLQIRGSENQLALTGSPDGSSWILSHDADGNLKLSKSQNTTPDPLSLDAAGNLSLAGVLKLKEIGKKKFKEIEEDYEDGTILFTGDDFLGKIKGKWKSLTEGGKTMEAEPANNNNDDPEITETPQQEVDILYGEDVPQDGPFGFRPRFIYVDLDPFAEPQNKYSEMVREIVYNNIGGDIRKLLEAGEDNEFRSGVVVRIGIIPDDKENPIRFIRSVSFGRVPIRFYEELKDPRIFIATAEALMKSGNLHPVRHSIDLILRLDKRQIPEPDWDWEGISGIVTETMVGSLNFLEGFDSPNESDGPWYWSGVIARVLVDNEATIYKLKFIPFGWFIRTYYNELKFSQNALETNSPSSERKELYWIDVPFRLTKEAFEKSFKGNIKENERAIKVYEELFKNMGLKGIRNPRSGVIARLLVDEAINIKISKFISFGTVPKGFFQEIKAMVREKNDPKDIDPLAGDTTLYPVDLVFEV